MKRVGFTRSTLVFKLPQGRAVLTWPESEALYPALMSEKALADWLRPEEDAAWEYLQPDK
jgi:hypothetical protein